MVESFSQLDHNLFPRKTLMLDCQFEAKSGSNPIESQHPEHEALSRTDLEFSLLRFFLKS